MNERAQANLQQYLDILQRLITELPQYSQDIHWDATYSVSMFQAIRIILSRVEEDAPPDMNGLQAYCEACEFLGNHTLTIDNSINVDFMEVIEAGLTALGYKGTATLVVKGEDWTAPDIVITGIIQQVPLWRRLLDIIQLTRSKHVRSR